MISALTRKYPCFGVKWFLLLFSLQSIFGLRRAEREREKRNWNPETDSNEPRNRLCLTQKTQDQARLSSNAQTHSSNLENPFDRTILDPHRADRTTGEIVAPQHRSTQNRSFSCYFCWVLRIWVLFLLSFDEFGFCPRPSFVVPIHQTQSPLSLNLTGFDEYFLLGFVSFVFIYWEMILIFVWMMRKCEKHDKNGFSRAFLRIQPNTRKYFPKHFLKYNKILENIFLSEK